MRPQLGDNGRSPTALILSLLSGLAGLCIAGHIEKSFFDGLSIGICILAFIIPYGFAGEDKRFRQ
jgi:hypothetical protein